MVNKLICWWKGHKPSNKVRVDTGECSIHGLNIKYNKWIAYRVCSRCGQEYEVRCEKIDGDKCLIGY